jgi:calcineurin-like phosphoesterase family protein
MAVLLTSDLHLGHQNITKFRQGPWGSDVKAHDQHIIAQWNSVVSNDDTVVVLGDFIMGHKAETLNYVKDLNGRRILLVPGNHDGPFSGNKPAYREKWIETYMAYGIEIMPEVVRNQWAMFPEDLAVDLSHFPFDQDTRHEDRFAANHPSKEGRPLLHGHVHDLWITRQGQINVGVDVWDYKPVSIEQLIPLIKSAKEVIA